MSVFSKKRLKKLEELRAIPASSLHNAFVRTDGKPIILLVDDEPDNLYALELLLRKDFFLITANSGKEGIEFLHRIQNPQDIAVIITDQRMPGVSGVDLLEEANIIAPACMRILLTAYSDVQDAINAINLADIYRYLVKPIDEFDLKLTVSKAVEAFDMKKNLNQCIRDLDKAVTEKTEMFTEDISRLKTSLNELRQVSITDPLTALYNRRGLDFLCDRDAANPASNNIQIQGGQGFLLCDIDHFKQINDTHGHLIGDEVLKAVADALRQCFRDTDYLIRWGGEEFLAVTKVKDQREMAAIAERLRQTIENLKVNLRTGKALTCTASIGYVCTASTPVTTQEWNEHIFLADECLYAAKHSGRNTWVGLSACTTDANNNAVNLIQLTQGTSLKTLLQSGKIRAFSSLEDIHLVRWKHS